MISLLFLFGLALLLSAFFSGSEMAFVSGDKIQLRDKAESGDVAAKKALAFYESPQEFLTSLLVGNNLVNVMATTIITYIFKVQWDIESEWLVTAIMAPLLIIFGETVPKGYCHIQAEGFLLRHSALLRIFDRLFYYPTKILLKAIHTLLAPLGTEERKSIFVNEREFRSLIEESARSGVVTRHEKKIIDTILDFERIRLSSVMRPVEDVVKIDIKAQVKEVKDLARETHARMVLVYEEDPSIVVGMIYVFDLLFVKKEKMGLKEFLRSPVFLSQETSIENAFLTLQARRQSYALVTNSSGDIVGAVPIERLLIPH